MYADAHANKWTLSLAVFLRLQQIKENKQFYTHGDKKKKVMDFIASRIKVSKSTVYQHLAILEEKGLVIRSKNGFRLASNKEISEKYKEKKKKLYIPVHVTTLRGIKDILKLIPVFSNLKSQERVLETRQHLCTIKANLEKGEFVSKKDLRKYKKSIANKKVEVETDPDVNLSLTGIATMMGCRSQSTGLKYKSIAIDYDLFVSEKRSNYHGQVRSKREFYERQETGEFPERSFTSKTLRVYSMRSCKITTRYNVAGYNRFHVSDFMSSLAVAMLQVRRQQNPKYKPSATWEDVERELWIENFGRTYYKETKKLINAEKSKERKKLKRREERLKKCKIGSIDATSAYKNEPPQFLKTVTDKEHKVIPLRNSGLEFDDLSKFAIR